MSGSAYGWIDRRIAFVGSTWPATLEAAGLSERDRATLRESDDLSLLRRSQIYRLAQALGCSMRTLLRVGDGRDAPFDEPFLDLARQQR